VRTQELLRWRDVSGSERVKAREESDSEAVPS